MNSAIPDTPSTTPISTAGTQTGAAPAPASASPAIAAPIVPPEIQQLFGSPALLATEDRKLYDRLLEATALKEKPKDAVEWLFIKEIVDCSWDVLRAHRFKNAIVKLQRKRAIKGVIKKAAPEQSTQQQDQMATGYFTNTTVRAQVDKILGSLGLSADCIDAQAICDASAELATINNLQGSAAARRNSALRELDRHRQELQVRSSRNDAATIDLVPATRPEEEPRH